jgi:hypothetical protein
MRKDFNIVVDFQREISCGVGEELRHVHPRLSTRRCYPRTPGYSLADFMHIFYRNKIMKRSCCVSYEPFRTKKKSKFRPQTQTIMREK